MTYYFKALRPWQWLKNTLIFIPYILGKEKYGSDVIITTDNPRSEAPQDILNDILPGLNRKPLLVEVDREKAINKGLRSLGPNDVLIIAGKGHEEYQEIKEELKAKLFEYLESTNDPRMKGLSPWDDYVFTGGDEWEK